MRNFVLLGVVMMALTVSCGNNNARKDGWNDSNVSQTKTSCTTTLTNQTFTKTATGTTTTTSTVNLTSAQATSFCGCMVDGLSTTVSVADVKALDVTNQQPLATYNQVLQIFNGCIKTANIDPGIVTIDSTTSAEPK